MDKRSTKTSLSSLETQVEQEERWDGQLPCVSHHSKRGCCQHNPTQSLIFHDPRLPPKPGNRFTRLLSWFWHNIQINCCPEETSQTADEPLFIDVDSEKEAEPTPPFRSELPFDYQSVATLAPVHPSMPYHLAIYHLDCVRRQLDPEVKVAFVPELSCSGTSHFFHNGPQYTWSSEIYFEDGSFLQKQEISYIMDKSSSWRTIKFSLCPHSITLKITGPWFTKNDGFYTARALLRFQPIGGEEFHGIKLWTSKKGSFVRMSCCIACHSDAEEFLELKGDQVHIRYTCFRDLGGATERSTPKWKSVLTGEHIKRRPSRFVLSKRVWKTAQRLGRPNLHLVTHDSLQGDQLLNK
ncbi:hypothetical protein F5X97DRAFT_337585 [Nemania serpens]|nr:hypothetical protein F5X97DRAFT_337585 [Nemania serpens]